MPSRLLPAAALLAAALLSGCGGGGAPAPAVPADAPAVAVVPGAFDATVVRVVDGDTVIAQVGGRGPKLRVRLVGVDTPETVKPNTPVACFGHQASSFTRSLLQGRRVRAAYEQERTDSYGRQLWDLWLPDGRYVQGLLVASGAARAYPYRPNTTYADVLADAQRRAERERRGLWGSCSATAAFPQLRGTARAGPGQ